jgi:hypothetical protein
LNILSENSPLTNHLFQMVHKSHQPKMTFNKDSIFFVKFLKIKFLLNQLMTEMICRDFKQDGSIKYASEKLQNEMKFILEAVMPQKIEF